MILRLTLLLFFGLWWLAPVQAADEPDLEAFMLLIEQTLDGAGPGTHVGDRSELYRSTAEGWQMQVMTIWDGEGWLVLALRLHHPERISEVEGQWLGHYERLLASITREQVPELEMPQLFDVPAPTWNPAMPGELRSRRFTFDGFWYEVRWLNQGGLDDGAEWALRSYELVALADE